MKDRTKDLQVLGFPLRIGIFFMLVFIPAASLQIYSHHQRQKNNVAFLKNPRTNDVFVMRKKRGSKTKYQVAKIQSIKKDHIVIALGRVQYPDASEAESAVASLKEFSPKTSWLPGIFERTLYRLSTKSLKSLNVNYVIRARHSS